MSANDDSRIRRVVHLIAIIFVLAGVVLFAVSTYSLVQSSRASRWPVSDAEPPLVLPPTESEVKTYDQPGRGRTLKFNILYRFAVDGVSYTGSRVAFGHTPFRWQLDDLLMRYRAGSTHQVQYDPSDPSTSSLETGAHFGLFFLTALSMLFVGGGWYGLRWSSPSAA